MNREREKTTSWSIRFKEVNDLLASLQTGELDTTQTIWAGMDSEIKDHLLSRCTECFKPTENPKDEPMLKSVEKLGEQYNTAEMTAFNAEQESMCNTLAAIYKIDQQSLYKLAEVVLK